MSGPLDAAIANPWGALDGLLDGPLHPGGAEATGELLDRAGVEDGTRVLDVGCGAGGALGLARDRGARAVGLDRDPGGGPRQLRGEMTAIPVADGSVEVVLAECVFCLADSLPAALAESRRVLADGGRLALSDVVASDPPNLPEAIARALCLTGRRDRTDLVAAIERAGFAVGEVQSHHEDLLAMRDDLAASVDYERLLPLLGERGQRLLDGIEALERAVEAGDVGYVSLVATTE